MMDKYGVDDAWEFLLERDLVHEQTLEVVTSINGYTMKSIDEVVYVLYGMDFEQLVEEDDDE